MRTREWMLIIVVAAALTAAVGDTGRESTVRRASGVERRGRSGR